MKPMRFRRAALVRGAETARAGAVAFVSLIPETRVGIYEVTGQIGVGGLGEVPDQRHRTGQCCTSPVASSAAMFMR